MADSLREPLVTSHGGGNNAGERIDSPRESAVGGKYVDSAAAASGSSAWFVVELKKQLSIAAPMICVNLLQYSINIISLMIVGHLGELELASASVAGSFANVTGFSLLIGMGTTLETLCGQAFGAKQYRSVGIYLQRAIVALNAVAIPLCFVWWNMEPILLAVGQDPAISAYAGVYARWLLPTLFAYATLQPLVKFLQAQSRVLPMACSSAVIMALHIPVCWFLVFKTSLGYDGAAIANGISQWLNVSLLCIYIKFSPTCARTWTGFSSEAFNDMKQFLWLALPSALMICLEYWSFELIVLMSGLLPNPQLEMSVLSISLSTLVIMYMVPFGLSAAASTRVSNELGAGNHVAAKRAVVVVLCLAFCEGVLMCIVVLSLRRVWPYTFTSEPEVVDYVASLMPLLAMIAVFDACQGVLSGVTRGCGMQHLGAYSNLGAYYVVGLPLAILLAFYFKMRGRGLWLGMMAALAVQGATLGLITYFSDWKKQAQAALDRVRVDHLPTDKATS